MKTIVYILIAVFIFGIIAAGVTKKVNTNNCILIQSVENTLSSESLSQSAKVISDRLKDFSSEKFDISIISDKYQIKVVFANNWDMKVAENLMIQKGTLAFYETYNHKSLSELINGDNHLFSLLDSVNVNKLDAEIGCTSMIKAGNVNDYVNSIGLSRKCKIAWRQVPENSAVCLYALKSDMEKGSLMTGSDIESVKANQDKTSKSFDIEIRFKKSAVEVWSDATKRNINNAIAIVLDDHVICAPILRSEINSGFCIVTGNFTEPEVRYIAALGNNGELPVSFKIVK